MVLKSRLLLILSFPLCLTAAAQDTTKRANPVLFTEGLFAITPATPNGLSLGLSANYQFKKNLFTARYISTMYLEPTAAVIAFIAIPYIKEKASAEEYALLYGLRNANKGHSYSFSIGLSYNNYAQNIVNTDNQRIRSISYYTGIPYELNVKWFKREKRRIRIYGLIPVGNPTALGAGAGFKIFGNISKRSTVGIGGVFGYGYHKKY